MLTVIQLVRCSQNSADVLHSGPDESKYNLHSQSLYYPFEVQPSLNSTHIRLKLYMPVLPHAGYMSHPCPSKFLGDFNNGSFFYRTSPDQLRIGPSWTDAILLFTWGWKQIFLSNRYILYGLMDGRKSSKSRRNSTIIPSSELSNRFNYITWCEY